MIKIEITSKQGGGIMITIEDFKKVIEKEPSLTGIGVNSLHRIKLNESISIDEAKERLKRERESFLLRFDEFLICCDWLAKFEKVRTPQFSSYYLKHVIEKLADSYISNGALIAAAFHLDLPIKFFPGSPNINVGISKKCPYLKKEKRTK